MTESPPVSIDEVRALVSERQRYDDWLSALEARRAETPARVFDRVFGDYSSRRDGVLSKLREHVPGLAQIGSTLEARLGELETQLGTLEDERAEAMLRTAVGEFDGERWEQVRQQVESQIAELGESRSTLLHEVDEVRTLLASARTGPDGDVSEDPIVADTTAADHDTDAATTTGVEATTPDALFAADDVEAADTQVTAEHPVAAVSHVDDMSMPTSIETVSIEEVFEATIASTAATDASTAPADEMADLDNALALFAHDKTADGYSAPAASVAPPSPTMPMPGATLPPSLDGLDVFDDAELGDLRMSPPNRATAMVTPPHAAPTHGAPSARSGATEQGKEGFDDLAFLRSVVDTGHQSGMARGATSGDQQKTLRCTECGTMNLPTEWYCERCGGELAAF